MPTFGNLGTWVNDNAAATVSWPSHSEGDIGILITSGRANSTFDSWDHTISGWTLLSSNFVSGDGNAHGALQLWWKVAGASEGTVDVPDSGNHNHSAIATFSGADTVSVLGTFSSGLGTSVSMTSGTTGGANRLIFGVCMNRIDGTTSDQISSWTNSNLASLTDRAWTGAQTDFAQGSGVDVFTGEKATAGAVGSTTATLATGGEYWVGAHLQIYTA